MLVKEYAKLVGVSTVYVTKCLKKNKPPKAISSYRKFGNTYELVINLDELDKEIKKRSKRNQLKN